MPSYDFSYLIEKIKHQEFEQEPFSHIYIEDFFSKEHFDEIISSQEISAPSAGSDKELINGLMEKGFKPISFPGCVTDIDKYISWHEQGKKASHHSACEGFGMALRLYDFPSPILQELNDFLASETFNRAIAEKFGVALDDCVIDGGIQKYLDGYEISPHPDIRKKAATFMVNINPSVESENQNHHTHYLRLKTSRAYVQKFWEGNDDVDRTWVPWGWADTIKQQNKNNSIVLFSPSNETLHGVKADYDHLITQRTQLYGNLWYKEECAKTILEWEDLDVLSRATSAQYKPTTKQKIAAMLPNNVKTAIKKTLMKSHDIGQRNV